jgi:tetratricopeptide (TPR) repeat protein
MDAVTYPKQSVVDFMAQNMVGLRVTFDTQPLARDFNLQWTPTLITLDPEGKEHHRTVGFLPPEEFVPSGWLGIAKFHFDAGRFQEAVAALQRILEEHPGSDAAAEAIFLRGVALYKHTHEPRHLKEAYERLQREWPSSEWAKRAQPYRLIP